MIEIDNALLNTLMEQNDAEITHMEMKDEFDFYTLVSTGNREGLDKRGFSLMDKGLGKLSDDYKRNIQYHYIISISLITRLCIEKGMPSETAYTLSDLYIQEVDTLDDPLEINKLHKKMVYDYTDRMKKINKKNNYCYHVTKVLNYVNNHINENISTDKISKMLNLNKSYLCTLFKKETGITIGNYIEYRKNELAKEYLSNTNIAYIDISSTLGYSSYSYFIKIFKKLNGVTPSEYRKQNFMNSIFH